MKNHPDRVQGDHAKKIATAKFAEISAAYELLTTSGGDAGASHPSFVGAPSYNNADASYVNMPFGGFNRQPFVSSFTPTMGFDPFGFGTFDSFHFTDPFELFRRTFGEVSGNDAPFASPFGASQFMQQGMGMNSGFGGFPSLFSYMTMPGNFGGGGNGFGTSTFSSSSYSFGGGAGTGGRMISSTTTVINGKTVTRTEETVIKPDGSRETVVDLTGDDIEEKIPAICVDDTKGIEQPTDEKPRKKGRYNPAVGSSSRKPTQTYDSYGYNTFSALEETAPKKEPKSKHPRRYKVVSKEQLEQQQSNQAAAACNGDNILLKSQLSDNETYVTSKSNTHGTDTPKARSTTNATNDDTALKRKKLQAESSPQRRGRKRKFCDFMYRCLICCFPPCKRRRVANDSRH
jgi:curved DNA-binding protein CbpA